MSFTTLSVIGLGYIGLPTAAAFASRQKQVVGVDINARAVETINRGEIHIVEPDLDRVVKEAVEGGVARFAFGALLASLFILWRYYRRHEARLMREADELFAARAAQER